MTRAELEQEEANLPFELKHVGEVSEESIRIIAELLFDLSESADTSAVSDT